MEKFYLDLLGYCAATLTTVAFVPQVLKTIKTKSAKDVSIGMFISFTIGVFLWIIYGLATNTKPIWISNFIIFCLAATQIALKLKYDRK
jgi:MtN3 and saliva related transmembrane protein